MARSVEIAFLSEGNAAAAALEVIARVLEPGSRTLPHITLRYASRSRGEVWGENAPVALTHGFVLEAPLVFGIEGDAEEVRTLVVACSSDDLEVHNYKPDYPSSILHITLYDGPPSQIARRALSILEHYPWGLVLQVPLNVFASGKAALRSSSSKLRNGALLTDSASDLLTSLYVEIGIPRGTSLQQLSEDQALILVDKLAERLHNDPTVHSVPARPAPDVDFRPQRLAGQLEFWSAAEVGALSETPSEQQRRSQRRRSAVITPPELARDVAEAIARLVPDDEMIDFGDPAVGSGILYAATRRAFGGERVNSARVVEIDPATAQLVERRWARSGISVLQGDFLNAAPELDAWSTVLANPPYLRSQAIEFDLEPLRLSLQSQLNLHISRRSDIYLYFVLRAHAWLREGAVAAWIIPAEFQVTTYGAALRKYLSENVTLLRMHTYSTDTPIFENALATTCVVIYRKESPRPDAKAMVSFGSTMSSPSSSFSCAAIQLQQARRWSYLSLTSKEVEGIESLRLGDLFELKRGIATGANSFFILSDGDLERLSVKQEWVLPLVPPARELRSGWIQSDENGNPRVSSPRWVINTSESVEKLRESSPRFAEYVQDLLETVGDRYLVSHRPAPLLQEARLPAPFLFLYMAKRVKSGTRFIRNESNSTYLNNYIGMYPKPKAFELFTGLGELHDRLMRIPASELERCGRLYGNGLLKLEPRELSEVRIEI